MDLAKLVQKRRQQLGWSQSDLARALGSSASRICKLEAGDPTVAANLKLRALEAMQARLTIALDADADPFSDPQLSEAQRQALSARLLRHRQAWQIARRYAVDASDVEHVLANLARPPLQRLAQSFARARLKRQPVQ